MKSKQGITLIELMVVVAIVAILAAVAVPIYTNYMQRARRAEAKTALEQLRAAQEMFRAERGRYSTNLLQLVNSWGVHNVAGPPGNPDYAILLNSFSATGFTAEAQPTTARQIGDGSLFIDQDGNKTPTDKWRK